MTNIKIVTDSSITIQEQLLKTYDITVVPLSVLVDGVLYSDADLKEVGKFRSLLRNSKELPKTSQPPVGVFADVYEKLVADGAEHIISIHLSHSLSGTVEAARQGALISGAKVTVIDSGFTDQAMGFQVLKAVQLVEQGATVDEILMQVEHTRQNTELFIGVSTLENLVKGGRISRAKGLLTSLLNIKVMMQMKNYELQPLTKGRGSKVFIKWLSDWKLQLAGRKVRHLGVSYSGTPEFAASVRERLLEMLEGIEIPVLETGSIIQTHTGEGAFAVMVEYE